MSRRHRRRRRRRLRRRRHHRHRQRHYRSTLIETCRSAKGTAVFVCTHSGYGKYADRSGRDVIPSQGARAGCVATKGGTGGNVHGGFQ